MNITKLFHQNENKKKKLDDLKKTFQSLSESEMNQIKGQGMKKQTNIWESGCGGIVPQ